MTTDELFEKLPSCHPTETSSVLEISKSLSGDYTADYYYYRHGNFYSLHPSPTPNEALQVLYDRMVQEGDINDKQPILEDET